MPGPYTVSVEMEESDNWSCRDLSGIKFRRPEGGASSECGEWEKRFSLFWASEAAAGAAVEDHDDGVDNNLHEQAMQFVNDNTSLDPSGGSMMSTGDRSVFPSNAAQEFEFNISSSFVERSCSFPYSATDSPADELFFRGQLLPLHLPPRLQMVLKLSSEKQQESERKQRCLSKIIPPLKLPDPVVLLQQKAFTSCNTVQASNDVAPSFLTASTASHSNGFSPSPGRNYSRSRNCWLQDPRDSRDSLTDRDSSSRESSSSRDSSGSSQDSCFSSSSGKLELRTTAASASENKASLHMNRVEVFNTQSCRSHTSNLSAWMRPTFKWKQLLLFGAKKSMSKAGATEEKGGQHQQRRPVSRRVLDDNFILEASNPDCFDPRDLSERYFSDCSGELSYSGDIGKAARAFERAILQADAHADHLRERDQRGLAKAREYIQKYMKILKPLNVKKDAKADAAADQESSKAGRSCKVTYTCNRQPAAPFLAFEKRSLRATSSSRSLPTFSRSSRFAPATNILLTPRRSPVMRSSSVGTPPLPCNSVSELHGAIQGAIAHCKESQISKP